MREIMVLFLDTVGILMFAMMIPLFWRAARGPTIIDRIVAVNLIGTKAMILLVIIGTIFGRVDMYVDLAITYALLNFIGSLAAAKFFRRRRAVEPKPAETELPHKTNLV